MSIGRDSDQQILPLALTVKPGETVALSTWFTAPAYAGTVRSYWKLMDEDGAFVFPDIEGIWTEVVVQAM